jgi:hypothetical protein
MQLQGRIALASGAARCRTGSDLALDGGLLAGSAARPEPARQGVGNAEQSSSKSSVTA